MSNQSAFGGRTNISISPDVLMQELEDEIVLLDLKGARYFGLDAVGADIWQRLSSGETRDEIVAGMLTTYTVDEATLAQDVDELLQALADADLIAVEWGVP